MQKKMLNVTDLGAYLYCPRKYYIEKVLGKRGPPNKAMIAGSIQHKVLEEFSKQEESLIKSFKTHLTKSEIKEKFNKLLDLIIQKIFSKNHYMIIKFKISKKELEEKIRKAMSKEVLLIVDSVSETMEKGFFGQELFENLEPKIISEMALYSDSLGLRGRADRVIISKENTIIPFELKTRTADKIWPSDEIQVTAYAMMLSEKYNKPVSLGILEAGSKRHEIEITEERKQKVLGLIKEVKNISKNPMFPSSFSKCQSCNWEEECENL